MLLISLERDSKLLSLFNCNQLETHLWGDPKYLSMKFLYGPFICMELIPKRLMVRCFLKNELL